MRRLLIFALIFAALLVACGENFNGGDNSQGLDDLPSAPAPAESDGALSQAESGEPESNGADNSEPDGSEPDGSEPDGSEPDGGTSSEPRPSILPLITEHGKSIVTYGDLRQEDFGELEEKLAEYDYNISFVVYSIDNSKAVSYNTQAKTFCASAIKAPFALFACRAMEELDISLSTPITYESKHYEPGTGDLQYLPVGSVFDLETVLGKAMSISDNVGYLMSVDYFGRENYNLWAESHGVESLKISPTVWSLKATALDFAKIWGEMYSYFATESPYAEFLYSSCTNTGGNFATEMLDVKYSHKQGHNRSGGWHSYTDAGIVWKGEESYVFAILSDIPGPNSVGKEMMTDIMTLIDNLF